MYEVWLPQALAIGIDYNTFFILSPRKLKQFKKAHDETIKEQNHLMWIQGMYIQCAIGSCFSKEGKYPKKPFDIIPGKSDKVKNEMLEWEKFKCNFVEIYEK